MAIEFEVEDGSGKADATSYMSVAEFRQFWENRGKNYADPVKTDIQIQAALNNATAFMGYSYAFEGTIWSSTQALDFPRTGVYNKNGIDVSNTVPEEVIEATAYLGEYEVLGKSLNVIQMGGLKSRSVGPASWSYASSVAAGRPQIRSAMALLEPYSRGPRVRRRLG